MPNCKIRAVLFDIGGVVVGSPIVGIQSYEVQHSLPPHYLNALITSCGEKGAFQRLERGEMVVGPEFWEQFGRELSDAGRGEKAYGAYCRKMKLEVPAQLPTELKIDGEDLWLTMMQPALVPDPTIIDAINALIQSGQFLIGALTNNALFPSTDPPLTKNQISPPSATEVPDLAPTLRPGRRRPTPVEYDGLKASLEEQARDGRKAGSNSALLRGLFDVFVESAVEGLRKPDPKFYQIALDRLGVKAEEVVFLDDIGRNLIPAREMGMHTIRVHPGRSAEAVAELEKLVQIPLRQANRRAKL